MIQRYIGSLRPFFRNLTVVCALLLLPFVSDAQLIVNSAVTSAQLMSALAGNGLTTSNVVINCPAGAYGTFSNGNTTNVGITNGIMLTTGNLASAVGPNNSASAGFCNNTSASDPQLVAIEPQATYDPCILEFDIVPQCNQLTISFVFGSEEYPEFVGLSFNDAFGFFISGPGPACQPGFYNNTNVATLPNNITPVSIDNVNNGPSNTGPCTNCAYYVDNTGGATIQYDGMTTVLTRNIQLCPCQTYHFKLAIADAGDCIYDSGVFVDFLSCSTALNVTTASTPSGCSGCSGTATATASGQGPFTYSWAPSGGSSATATNLCPGTYTVTVDDGISCSPPTTQTVTVGSTSAPITIATPATNVSCNGGCNGSITANPSSGSAPYSYSWAPGGQTTQTINGLCAGSYTVTVTDASGCTGTASYTITQPTALASTASSTPATCGSNNGTATASPSGGTGPYSYSWAPSGGTGVTASNLAVGTYTVTVTDANGCTITATTSVTNTGGINSSITASANIQCFGGNNGSATATPTGGTGPYTYAWTPSGGTAATATGLSPGTYTCTITDVNNCVTTSTVTITEPPALTVSSSQTDVLCYGTANGNATVTIGGGTPGYTYAWSPSGGSSATASGLTAGTYTCNVTDLNGCTITQSFTITEPPQLTSTSTGLDVTCNGACNGQLVTIPGGGVQPYTFAWNTGCTNPSCNNICPGTYTVTITDANGCTSSSTASVTEPPAVTLSTSVQDANCGATDGSATVTPAGGVSPYTYSWSSGSTSATQNNIGAGTYTVTVTDANGCTQTVTAVVGNINGVTASSAGSTDATCFNACDGTASVLAGNGTPPYSYNWTPSGGNAASATGLCAGTYTCTITDAATCVTTVTFTINQPAQLTAVAAAATGVCSGTATNLGVTPGGGTGPYTIVWNPGALAGATPSVTPSSTTTYTATVTDANGCTVTATQTVNVNAIPQSNFIADVTSGCAPLCINFSDLSTLSPPEVISGWSWNFGDGGTSSVQNPNYCYSTPGVYTVSLTVTSNNGCANTFTINNYITVDPSPTAAFSFTPTDATVLDPTIWFTDNSSGATSWNWNFGDPLSTTSILQNPNFTYLDSGCYVVTLTVSNAGGCTDDTSAIVCIDPDWTIYVPNCFTPNDDGINDFFRPEGYGIDPENYELWIFDRWGNMIFYTDDWYKSWDGKVQGGRSGALAQIDTYVWKIKCKDILGDKHRYIGKVSLIR